MEEIKVWVCVATWIGVVNIALILYALVGIRELLKHIKILERKA